MFRLMDLQEFCRKYPNLARHEIAEVAGCKPSLVDRWFMTGDTKRTPTSQHRDRFAMADWVWSQMDAEPDQIKMLRRLKPSVQNAPN